MSGLITRSGVQVPPGEQKRLVLQQCKTGLFSFMAYYVYILYSEKSDKYYVGQTDNVERRLIEHNEQEKVSYTSKHRPWRLCASFFAGNTRGEAMKVEKFIKRQKSRKFIEKVIEAAPNSKQIAQLVGVPMSRD